MITIETKSPEETFKAAAGIGELAQAGDVYALSGELGAGKTVFAKGLAAGLGIEEEVNSPTFTIVQEYEGGRLPFYHFDAYRVDDPEEMIEVGLDHYLAAGGVCLVEWPERIAELLPADAGFIQIRKDPAKGMNYRELCIEVPER